MGPNDLTIKASGGPGLLDHCHKLAAKKSEPDGGPKLVHPLSAMEADFQDSRPADPAALEALLAMDGEGLTGEVEAELAFLKA